MVWVWSWLSFDGCFILFYRSHSYRGAAVVPRSNWRSWAKSRQTHVQDPFAYWVWSSMGLFKYLHVHHAASHVYTKKMGPYGVICTAIRRDSVLSQGFLFRCNLQFFSCEISPGGCLKYLQLFFFLFCFLLFLVFLFVLMLLLLLLVAFIYLSLLFLMYSLRPHIETSTLPSILVSRLLPYILDILSADVIS